MRVEPQEHRLETSLGCTALAHPPFGLFPIARNAYLAPVFNSLAPLGERVGVRGWLGAAPALTTLTPTLSRQREREKQPQSVVDVA